MTRHAGATGKASREEDIPRLLRDVESRLVERCIPAARALADLGVQDAIPAMTRGVRDCRRYGPPKTAARVWRAFLECLARLGESQPVIEDLSSPQHSTPWAAELLGRYPSEAGVEALLRVVQGAADALADPRFRLADSPPSGRKSLHSFAVIGAAIRSLGRINEKRAEKPLYLLLVAPAENFESYHTVQDPDFGVIRGAIRTSRAGDYDRLCRRPAAQVLARMGARETLEQALAVVKGHPSIQQMVASALAELKRSP